VYAAGPLFARRPGEAFEYSNLGFGMIGRVVRRVTGRPVQEHVTERLLEPLGMHRTTWVQPAHDDWARPHRVRDGVSIPDPDPLLGDGEIAPMGGLWSTVSDLARWVSWLDAAVTRPDDTALGLSTASRREMQRHHTYAGMTELAERRCPSGYGFGLLMRDDPVVGKVIGHSGGLPGYGSNMRWCPGRGVAAIALANTTYAPMAELTMRMLDDLHLAGLIPAAVVPDIRPGFELDVLARRLVALLDNWTDEAAAALFADNVALDDPLDRRAAEARNRVATHGRLRVAEVTATTAAAASIRVIADDTTEFTISLSLAPLGAPRVQQYEVAVSLHA
jgi:CubicO group peptidase (beta-lactamase class C family)